MPDEKMLVSSKIGRIAFCRLLLAARYLPVEQPFFPLKVRKTVLKTNNQQRATGNDLYLCPS